MKVAVLLTGALRTIKKTIVFLKKNVLINNDVAVFACIQNDTTQPNNEWDDWFKMEICSNIKSIEWFSLDTSPEFIRQRERLLANITVPEHLKMYLRNSGSIIEYIQLQYAFIKMNYFEQVNSNYFDYIIKVRTDSIYTKPIDFHWLLWSDEDVAKRFNYIQEKLTEDGKIPSVKNIFHKFMQTLIADELLDNASLIYGDYIENTQSKDLENMLTSVLLESSTSTSFDKNNKIGEILNNYLQSGSYILTFRANNLYIAPRNKFYMIPSLGTMYGLYHYPKEEPDYWWNAETQFRAACYLSGLAIFDYSTTFEELSLYHFDKDKYFNEKNELINTSMVYCLVRN